MRTVFSVSGNQVLSLYEAFATAGLRIVHMRHESAAAYAAAGLAEVTGEMGIVLVAGGPGFLASLVGVAVSASLELPLLLISGGPPANGDRPGAFQYVDQARIASAVCKQTSRIARVDEIEECVVNAMATALDGVPGPVHVMVPVDIALAAPDEIATILANASMYVTQTPVPDEGGLRRIADGLATAKRPLVIARPSAARGAAGETLRELCRRLGAKPAIMESPRGSEDLKYRAVMSRYADADYALLVGPADFSVGFLSGEFVAKGGRAALIDAPGDPQVARDVDVHVRANAASALAALVKMLPDAARTPWTGAATPLERIDTGNALHPLRVGELLAAALEPSDLIVLDGGEFGQWMRAALATVTNRVIWNSRMGAIGGSVPLALGAALAQPERRVIVAVGDGAFGYHGTEIETAVREGARLTILIGNDDRWGAEWHTQREKYGRAVATMLGTVSYDEVARGFGALGYEVSDEGDLQRSLALALAADETVALNVRIASVRSPATAP